MAVKQLKPKSGSGVVYAQRNDEKENQEEYPFENGVKAIAESMYEGGKKVLSGAYEGSKEFVQNVYGQSGRVLSSVYENSKAVVNGDKSVGDAFADTGKVCLDATVENGKALYSGGKTFVGSVVDGGKTVAQGVMEGGPFVIDGVKQYGQAFIQDSASMQDVASGALCGPSQGALKGISPKLSKESHKQAGSLVSKAVDVVSDSVSKVKMTTDGMCMHKRFSDLRGRLFESDVLRDDSSRPLPSVGEELLSQVQAGQQADFADMDY